MVEDTEVSNEQQSAEQETMLTLEHHEVVPALQVLFFEAYRLQGDLTALNQARQAAEAIVIGIGPLLPDEQQAKYKGQLNSRLTSLENWMSESKAPAVPKQVLAALRTLQAYGNYGSHYHHKEPEPSPDIGRSALASLRVATFWALEAFGAGGYLRGKDAGTRPGIVDRFKIAWNLPSPPSPVDLFEYNNGDEPGPFLARLGVRIEDQAATVKAIAKIVLKHEIGIEPNARDGLPQLALNFSRAQADSEGRIPELVAQDVNAMASLQLRTQAQRRGPDDNPLELLAELEHRDHAKELTRWFHRDYLRRSWLERYWLHALAITTLCWWFGSGWIDDARQKERRANQAEVCADSKVASQLISFCDDFSPDVAPEEPSH